MKMRNIFSAVLSSTLLVSSVIVPAHATSSYYGMNDGDVVSGWISTNLEEVDALAENEINVDIEFGEFSFEYNCEYEYDPATGTNVLVSESWDDDTDTVTVTNYTDGAVYVSVSYEDTDKADGVTLSLSNTSNIQLLAKDNVVVTGTISGRPADTVKADKLQEIGNIVVTITSASLEPVLHLDFNQLGSGALAASSDVNEVSLSFTNALAQGGYEGSAPRFCFGKDSYAELPAGTVANLIKGKSSYSVSMWLMANPINGLGYRATTLYGSNGVSFMYMTVYDERIVVRVSRASGGVYDCYFDYKLDSRVPTPNSLAYTNAGVWQLATVSIDFARDTVQLYINGQERAMTKLTAGSDTAISMESLDIGYASFPAQSNLTTTDRIGGDANGGQYSFNGILDEYMVFDRALSATEARALYLSFGESVTPSITEEQDQLDLLAEKLGSGVVLKANSENIIYNKRVSKADVNDYSAKNILVGDEMMITADLCKRLGGTVNGQTFVINGKSVSGTTQNGDVYFPAADICTAMGWRYIDQTATNGIFMMLATDSSLNVQTDAKLIQRMVDFCTVGDYEPTVNAEQSRVEIQTAANASATNANHRYIYSPSITKIGNNLFASCDYNESSASCNTEIFMSSDNGATWKSVKTIVGLYWATLFEDNGALYVIGSSGGLGIGIAKCTDATTDGTTWSSLAYIKKGAAADAAPHCGPTAVLKLNGKIYRSFEKQGSTPGLYYVCADQGANLLSADSWTVSESYQGNVTPGDNDGWINESNVVKGPDGNPWIISRNNLVGKAALFKTVNGKIVPYASTYANSGVVNEGTVASGLLTMSGTKSYYTAPASQTVTTKIYSEISLRPVSGWTNVYFTNKISGQGYHIQVRADGDVLLFGGSSNAYIAAIGKNNPASGFCKIGFEMDLENDKIRVSVNGAAAKEYTASTSAYYTSNNTDTKGYSRVLISGQTADSSAKVEYVKVSTGSTTTWDLVNDDFRVESAFIDFPSVSSKFTCRYDETTGRYIALTCPLVDPNSPKQRNYCALAVSTDLVHWETTEQVDILLCDRELYNAELSTAQHAFQYADWIIDGDDILFVVRESAEDAKNFHDANYLTFYRLSNYAALVNN